MPKVTIDGQQREVDNGRTIIEAARDAGISIPYYCWHPRLSVAANCRMCLVEVERAPKLLPACEVRVREGMIVHTQSKNVLGAREAVMEFLLVNHPIDCPICDQAGECKLQDYYMAHDRSGTRFSETKVVKNKAVDLGPTIVLDEERCINCTRCIRFMDEIAGNPQLGQFDRGDRAVIGIFPGQPLDDPYSMNVAEICPVGALTTKDFRFKVRSWFLKSTPTLCVGCGRGCNILLDAYNNEVQRYRGRDNEFVNQGWLCDDGRLSYRRVHDPETQIAVPHVRADDGRMVPTSWTEAGVKLAELLGPHAEETDGTLGLALSSQLTTEGVTAFVELAERVLQVDTYAIVGRPDWEKDRLLKVTDRNPNRSGAELVLEGYSIFDEGAPGLKKALREKSVKTLIMAGSDYPEPDPVWTQALSEATVVAFTSNWDASSEQADLVIPLASFAEQDGTFVNVKGRMQRVTRALRPMNGRKDAVEAATFAAEALGAGADWTMRNWITAFNELKRRTDLLKGISPLKLGPWGVLLASEEDQVSADLDTRPAAS